MKAFVVKEFGSIDNLYWTEISDFILSPTQIEIETKAAGVNYADVLTIRGKYQTKPNLPYIPGFEVSGIVKRVGENVQNFSIGDRVMGICWTGGYAEKTILEEIQCTKIPNSMSFEEAAGFCVVYESAYFALVTQGRLKSNETLVVHSAAGGMGTASVQIGKAIGAVVIGTVSSDQKFEHVYQSGADDVINYTNKDWYKIIQEKYNGADVILETVGGDVLQNSLSCIKFEGRIIVAGFSSGDIPSITANRIMLKNITVAGVHWNLYRQNHPQKVQSALKELLDWYKFQKLKMPIYEVRNLADAPTALRDMMDRKISGKLILSSLKI